jgi:hypothetical protein
MVSQHSRPDATTLTTVTLSECAMQINFESTMTEADFKKPLLDPAEDRVAREMCGGVDLKVDGLVDSLLGRVMLLFTGRGR